MFKKIFGKNNNAVAEATVKATKKLTMNHGDVLRLIMKDGERREVSIIAVHKESMRVRELFHGIYDLPYDDIILVYQGNDLYTFVDIKKCVMSRVA